jgi:hypothetical protein
MTRTKWTAGISGLVVGAALVVSSLGASPAAAEFSKPTTQPVPSTYDRCVDALFVWQFSITATPQDQANAKQTYDSLNCNRVLGLTR